MLGMQLHNFSFTLKLKLVIIKRVVAYQSEDKFWSLTSLEACQVVELSQGLFSFPCAHGTPTDINVESNKYHNKLIAM